MRTCRIVSNAVFFQARGHSTALSVGPPSPRRETCFATSNCTPGRSLSNARCAATPVGDVTLWAGTCAPTLVPGSHTHTRTHTDKLWYCMHLRTVPCWLVSHSFWIWGLLRLHGFSSNTLPCILIWLHTSHMISLLIHLWKLTHSLSVHVFLLHGLQYAHHHQFCTKPLT